MKAVGGYNGSAAVSVFNSNSTADVTSLANLQIGGDLTVEGQRTDHNWTNAISNSGPTGKAGISLALSLATEQTNAYLDGTADVMGDILVSATAQNAPISQNKLGLPATSTRRGGKRRRRLRRADGRPFDRLSIGLRE